MITIRISKASLVLLLAVLGCTAVLVGANVNPKSVEAERFVLQDQEGREGATLGFDPDGSVSLILREPAGEERIKLSVKPDGTAVQSFLFQGVPQLQLDAKPNGAAGFSLGARDGALYGSVDPAGNAEVGMDDRNGKVANQPDGLVTNLLGEHRCLRSGQEGPNRAPGRAFGECGRERQRPGGAYSGCSRGPGGRRAFAPIPGSERQTAPYLRCAPRRARRSRCSIATNGPGSSRECNPNDSTEITLAGPTGPSRLRHEAPPARRGPRWWTTTPRPGLTWD